MSAPPVTWRVLALVLGGALSIAGAGWASATALAGKADRRDVADLRAQLAEVRGDVRVIRSVVERLERK